MFGVRKACRDLANILREIQQENDRLNAENSKLREYVQTLEAANIDVTSRLQDYIGQYDPTDAFVIEAKAENAKLRRAFNETLIRLVAANDVAVSSYMDDEYLELMRKLGIEVDA